jgi:sugar lactone lactonase YvrE
VIHPDPSSVDVRASAGSTSVLGVVAADGRFFVKDVPVAEGARMTLTVTASHAGNDADTKSVTLSRTPDATLVKSMILDSARDRYLLADRYNGTIVAVARSGYARSVVSGAGRGSGARLNEPVALALDAARGQLYVADRALETVLRVDALTGDRTIVSGGGLLGNETGSGPPLFDPAAVVYDPARRTLFVAEDNSNSLFAVDPVSGARTTVSDNSPAFGPTLFNWDGVGLDAARNRVVVVTPGIGEQYAIDLTTGVHSLVSDPSRDIPGVSRGFTAISVAPTRGVAYLADDFSNAVVRMDLATGARTSVTSSGLSAGPLTHPVIGTGPELEWPTAVLYDETQSRLFVIDFGFAGPLIEVDETTGNRTLLTNGAVGTGINFKEAGGLALDPGGRTAYVVDVTADIVVAVNLDDGSRRLIAGSPTGRGSIDTGPVAVDVDAAAGELYIVDFYENSLYSLDVATGARRTISDASTGTGPLFDSPVDLSVDSTAGFAYVLDLQLDALLAIDLVSGDRRIVASGFVRPAGLALDRARGLAYVSANDYDVIRVDVVSGQMTVVSSTSVGTGPRPGDLTRLALDATQGRLLALDVYPNRVLSIDIATGTRSVVSGLNQNGGTDIGGGPNLAYPRSIDVDESREIAYVTDSLYNAVIAVDLSSGYRQIVAR